MWRNISSPYSYFYPRPPRGGRQHRRRTERGEGAFLSTPSARRATGACSGCPARNDISIHALREEGDERRRRSLWEPDHFYPRPPRGGRPAAGCRRPCGSFDFYPRPPRGGRPWRLLWHYLSMTISIHALREEGDELLPGMRNEIGDFYPRPPRGGRQPPHHSFCPQERISIHALREEGDRRIRCYSFRLPCISIHALREEGDRRIRCYSFRLPCISIHALREEGDTSYSAARGALNISIHALREEGDAELFRCRPAGEDFYPRPPRGGRHISSLCSDLTEDISIHALREEGDLRYRKCRLFSSIFLSTPSARRATYQPAVGCRRF